MRQEHSVPLNETACYVLNIIQKHNSSDFIFLNNSKKSHISNNNMRLLLKNNFPEILKKLCHMVSDRHLEIGPKKIIIFKSSHRALPCSLNKNKVEKLI